MSLRKKDFNEINLPLTGNITLRDSYDVYLFTLCFRK